MTIRASAPRNYQRRRLADQLTRLLMIAATAIAIVPLVLIIGYVLYVGGSAMTLDFFTKSYLPPSFGNASSGTGDPSVEPIEAAPAPAKPVQPGAKPAQPAAKPTKPAQPGATADPFAGIGIDNVPGAKPAQPGATADPFAGIGIDNVPGTKPAQPGATADPFAGIGIDNVPGTKPAQPAAKPTKPAQPGATADPFGNLEGIPGVQPEGPPATVPATAPAATGRGGATSLANIQAQGGVIHGIIGTLLITGLALLIAIPIGVMAGIFLSEYPDNALAIFVRFCGDVLSGAPSIIVGVAAYALIVQQTRTYSGYAGSVALAVLMIPIITRTTEEILKLVPDAVREAALALGAPTWWATFTVVIRTALVGVVTGVLLAFARGAGETAPLLLTIQGNNRASFDMSSPMAALPLLIYRYTESPFPSENKLAWGAAFVLTMLVLTVNILARLATRKSTVL